MISPLASRLDCSGRMSAASFNARGMKRNRLQIRSLMVQKKIDFMVVQETWLQPNENVHELREFLVSSASSKEKHGGGIALLASAKVKSRIKIIGHHDKGYWGLWKVDKIYVVGCYFPPKLEHSLVIELMEQIRRRLKSRLDIDHSQILLLGDMNPQKQHEVRREETLRNWLLIMELEVLNDTLGPTGKGTTFNASGENTGNVLDWIVASSEIVRNSLRLEYLEEERDDSDHCPVLLEWNYSLETIQEKKTIRAKRWKMSKLQDPKTRKDFATMQREQFRDFNRALEQIDIDKGLENTREERGKFLSMLYQRFCEINYEVADKVIGRAKANPGKIPAPPSTLHISKALCKATRERQRARKRRDILKKGPERKARHEEYKAAKQKVRREERSLASKTYGHYLSRLSKMEPMECISRLGKQAKAKTSGTQFPLDQELIEKGAEFYSKHFCPIYVNDTKVRKALIDEVNPYPHKEEDPTVSGLLELTDCFNTGSLIAIFEKNKNNKASGSDAVVREFFFFPKVRSKIEGLNYVYKPYEDPLLLAVQSIFQLSAIWMVTPEQWAKGQIVPLYKNKGDRDD